MIVNLKLGSKFLFKKYQQNQNYWKKLILISFPYLYSSWLFLNFKIKIISHPMKTANGQQSLKRERQPKYTSYFWINMNRIQRNK